MSDLRDYFQFRSYYPVSVDAAKAKSYFVQSADLNLDGYKDVLFLGATYPIASNTNSSPQSGLFYLGSSDYKYNLADLSTISVPNTVHPRELAYADFNGDGKLDIFIADHGWDTNPYPGGQNQLILSTSNGWEVASSKLPQRQDFTHSTAVGDINNDGNFDIFVGNVNTGTSAYSSSVLLGDGKGGFTESTALLPLEIQGANAIRTTAVQITDLNKDGWPELIYGNDGRPFNSKSNSLVYWNNKGSFTNNNSSLIPNGYFGIKNEHVLDIQSADLDGDGVKEIVSLSTQLQPFYDGWSLQVLRVTGEVISDMTSKAFGENIYKMGQPNVSTTSPWVPFVNLVDVNSDGTLDMLFDDVKMSRTMDQGTMPIMYLNDGFAHFTPIFASDLLESFPEKALGSSFNDFFNSASSFFGKDGVSWINKFVMASDGKVYFRELIPTKPLPQIATITATDGPDIVIGNDNHNFLYGLAGNDLLVGGLGNDSMDGGLGIDTVKVDAFFGSANEKNYSLTKSTASNWTLSYTGPTITIYPPPATNGTDTLIDIERLKFNDKSIALDLDGNAGKSAKIIGAVLGSAFVSNPLFAGIGIDYLDKGMSYSDLGAFALKAVGAGTHDAIVSTLWRNVVGIEANSEQKSPYTKMLSEGMKFGDLVVLAADTSFNTTNINLVGLAQTGIEYIPVS